MRIPLSRTKQEIEVENEAHAPLPGCPTPHRLFRPDLLFTSDCSHRSFRAEAEDMVCRHDSWIAPSSASYRLCDPEQVTLSVLSVSTSAKSGWCNRLGLTGCILQILTRLISQ